MEYVFLCSFSDTARDYFLTVEPRTIRICVQYAWWLHAARLNLVFPVPHNNTKLHSHRRTILSDVWKKSSTRTSVYIDR